MRWIGWALAVAWLLPRPADAQVADALYADARAIVVELVESEAARVLVPQIVCRLDPSVHLYYGRTLQRVYTRQFGDVGPVVVGDTAALLRDATLRALVPDGEVAPTPAALMTHAARRIAGASPDPFDNCVAGLRDQPDLLAPAVLRSLYGDPAPTALYRRRCAAPAPDDTAACEVAEAVAQGVVGNAAAARLRVMRAVAISATRSPQQPPDPTRLAVVMGLLNGDQPTADALDALSPPEQARARTLAYALRAALQPGTPADDILASLTTLLATACQLGEPADPRLCSPAARPRLDALDALLAAASRGELAGVANHLIAADVDLTGALARDQASRIGDTAAGEDPEERARFHRVFTRFLLAIVRYALAGRDGAAPPASAREAFRSAAVDALRTAGFGVSGIDRPTFADWAAYVWLPQPTVRAGVSRSFLQGERDGLRTVIGLDLINLKARLWYTEQVYLAVNLSLLDPLAPLAEYVYRSNGTYLDPYAIWFNAISPRLQLFMGVPAWSRRLVGTIDLGVRPCVVERTVDDERALVELAYGCWPGDGRNVEAGVGVKYLF